MNKTVNKLINRGIETIQFLFARYQNLMKYSARQFFHIIILEKKFADKFYLVSRDIYLDLPLQYYYSVR